jgi:hypothetical protein
MLIWALACPTGKPSKMKETSYRPVKHHIMNVRYITLPLVRALEKTSTCHKGDCQLSMLGLLGLYQSQRLTFQSSYFRPHVACHFVGLLYKIPYHTPALPTNSLRKLNKGNSCHIHKACIRVYPQSVRRHLNKSTNKA